MAVPSNHLAIYKLLPKTNCRDCGLSACLAFAVAVMQGQKSMADCPHLSPEEAARFSDAAGQRPQPADDLEQRMLALQEEASRLDLGEAAQRLGLELRQGRLVIPCLGKEFSLGPDGLISSCHVNGWLSLPMLNYALRGAGRQPLGKWLPLRELPGGLDWGRFFEHRCEKQIKKIIDEYTDLFEIIIEIFAGQPAPDQFDSDIAVLIHPLPKLPVLLCYWKPDEGLESSLHMFFDQTAENNLNIESIYILCTGLAIMFEKIARTHGR